MPRITRQGCDCMCKHVTDVTYFVYGSHHPGAQTRESTDSQPLSFLLSRLLTPHTSADSNTACLSILPDPQHMYTI